MLSRRQRTIDSLMRLHPPEVAGAARMYGERLDSYSKEELMAAIVHLHEQRLKEDAERERQWKFLERIRRLRALLG
jgi:hypothetical protein